MTRVLHVVCDLCGGGAERLVLELCRRAAPDIEAQVATVQPGGELQSVFAAAGVQVRCAERHPGRLGLRAERRLVQWCREVDVVHTHLFAGDVWGRTAAMLAGTPVVSTEHNVDRDEPDWKHRVKALLARGCAGVYAVSDAVAAHWQAWGVRCEVVPNGVDLDRFSAPWDPEPGRVLAIGRLGEQKGHDALLEATADLDCSVQIAGEGPWRERLSCRPHQVLLGSRSDIPELLCRAAVLAVPSRWEGFGLVALEGMAAGVPVIASDVDGLGPLVGDAGLLVPPGDVGALREAVSRVLEDPALARDLSARGRARAQAYGLDAMVRRYEAIYRSV